MPNCNLFGDPSGLCQPQPPSGHFPRTQGLPHRSLTVHQHEAYNITGRNWLLGDRYASAPNAPRVLGSRVKLAGGHFGSREVGANGGTRALVFRLAQAAHRSSTLHPGRQLLGTAAPRHGALRVSLHEWKICRALPRLPGGCRTRGVAMFRWECETYL